MNLLKASKILHVIVLLSCFLPAIFLGCEDSPTKKELEERAKAVQDSLDNVAKTDSIKINLSDSVLTENKTDTSYADTTTVVAAKIDTIKVDTIKVAESANDTSAVKNKESGSEVLQDLLNRLVFPDRENLSMVGYLLIGFSNASPILFMFLLIWSTGLRFRSNNHKLIFIQTFIGFIALSLFFPDKLKDIMWGFWIVYALSLLNTTLNWWIYYKAKKSKLTSVWGDLE